MYILSRYNLKIFKHRLVLNKCLVIPQANLLIIYSKIMLDHI